MITSEKFQELYLKAKTDPNMTAHQKMVVAAEIFQKKLYDTLSDLEKDSLYLIDAETSDEVHRRVISIVQRKVEESGLFQAKPTIQWSKLSSTSYYALHNTVRLNKEQFDFLSTVAFPYSAEVVEHAYGAFKQSQRFGGFTLNTTGDLQRLGNDRRSAFLKDQKPKMNEDGTENFLRFVLF